MAHQIDESKPKYLSQTRFMSGRRIIKTSVTEITDENVVDVLRKALATHELNRSEIDYLWKYYRGDQPIRNRVKDVRPEICNKITENRANEIVSFKVGYLCGEPIQYVSRNGGEEIVKQINTLNEYMFAEDKAAQDQELVEWQMICGTAFRLVLPDEPGEEDEAPFELYTLDPRDTFVVYAPKSDEMVLTVHRWFANKSCPGDWLYNRLGNLAAEVTKRLTGGSTDTGKVDVPSDGKTLYRVQTGVFSKGSNADAWAAKLKAAGFDTYIVQMGNLYKVQVGAYSQKSNAENMMAKLKAAGYDAFITTKSGTAAGTAKKSAAEIAKEIYNGTCSDSRWSSWGNGADRVNRLKQAGYDPSEVQSEVNKLF